MVSSGVRLTRLRSWLAAESEATGLPLGALLATALAIHVWVTAIALNPWHPDEHFQILEFAWARLGLGSTADLPWEWDARIRPTLQPTLAMGVLAALRAVGVESPWTWVLLLRLGTLAVAFAVLLRVVAHTSADLAQPARRALWGTALLLWFAPLLLGRFTSENLGGLALAAALPIVDGQRPGSRGAALAGALLGLSFLFRYQMALAILPIMAWVAWRHGWGPAALVVLVALGVTAGGALLDAWFYGAWTFTPWNYFRINLLEGVASSFGTEPWHYYLTTALLYMAPPVGLAVALLPLVGAASRPRSPWSWALIAFLLGHSGLAHKEPRFFFPMLFLVPVLTAWGVQAAAAWGDARAPGGRVRRWRVGALRALAWVVMAQNGILLALLATPFIHRGKDFDAHALRFLWNTAEAQPGRTIYVLDNPSRSGRYNDLRIRVFDHPRVRLVDHHRGAPVPGEVPTDTPPEQLLLIAWGNAPPDVGGAGSTELVYAAEPGYRVMARAMGMEDWGWLTWLERVDRWVGAAGARRIYRVQLEEGASR